MGVGMQSQLDRDLGRVQQEISPAQRMWVLDAALKGHLDQLQAIDAKGLPLNCKGDWGEEAIHVAAGKGHLEVVKYLVGKFGVETCRARDGNNKTPLHYAARNMHLDTVKWLCSSAGASRLQDDRDYKGRRPIDVCREVNAHDCDTAYWLENGRDKPPPAPVRQVYRSS